MKKPKIVRALWDGEIVKPPPILWMDEYEGRAVLWGKWRDFDGARVFWLPRNWVLT